MAFNTSLSGISAANADLSVTSNNIANVNTIGFKESRAEFADIFQSSSYGLARNTIGSGARLSQVSQQFKRGPINQTGRSMDMAVSGEGFFTLSANGNRVYSRAGNFHPDANGYVVNPQGARLQVFAPNASGKGFDVGQMTDLQLRGTTSPPKATQTINLGVNLPAGADKPKVEPFDKADSNSYNHSSGGMTVYDSLGVPHVQTSYFVKTGEAKDNTWEVHSFIDGEPVSKTPAALEFDTNGKLIKPDPAQIALDEFTPAGASPMQLTLDIAGSAQFGTAFALNDFRQDGHTTGKLNEIEVDNNGVVYARYSNNADIALGQVALAIFPNSQGLQQEGNNIWTQTAGSGDARIGAPDTADFGQIAGGALEGSTVDLTEQMVNMIVAQRNFQANAQMLTTQDQVTQTVLNIR